MTVGTPKRPDLVATNNYPDPYPVMNIYEEYPELLKQTIEWPNVENPMSWKPTDKPVFMPQFSIVDEASGPADDLFGPCIDKMTREELEKEHIQLQDDFVELFDDYEETTMDVLELEAEVAVLRFENAILERELEKANDLLG